MANTMSCENSHILVTGGAGYIGSHVVVGLLQAGYKISIFDNFSNSSLSAIERIYKLSGKLFDVYKGDIACSETIDDVISKTKPSGIMHFAGLKSISESISYPQKYWEVNVGGTQNILDSMSRHHIQKLVFSSSAAVYGTKSSVAIDETADLCPDNPYGESKLKCETLIRELISTKRNISAAVLRYFNPVGAHQSGMLGEFSKNNSSNLMPVITQVAAGQKTQLSVFGGGFDTIDGTGVRDYIHISDLVRGHIKALEFIKDFSGFEIFNLGSGTGYSVLEVIETFKKVTGITIDYKILGRRKGDSDTVIACPVKAKKILGWRAELGLSEICRDAWAWHKYNHSHDLNFQDMNWVKPNRKSGYFESISSVMSQVDTPSHATCLKPKPLQNVVSDV